MSFRNKDKLEATVRIIRSQQTCYYKEGYYMKIIWHFFFPAPEFGVNWGEIRSKMGCTQRTLKIP